MTDRIQRAFHTIGKRSVWERRQRAYYLMRHDGLPRRNKPFQTAADAHFPLIDMTIADLKPFWVQQIYNGDRVCDFVCLKDQFKDMTEAAADYYDYELRYNTDFRLKVERAIDTMLVRGRGILKVSFNPFTNKIEYESVDPVFLIMDSGFDDLDSADWFTEVQTLTVGQYMRNRQFNRTQATLDAIKGRSADQLEQLRIDKQLQEGFSYSEDENRIILWHTYERTESGWVVHTECPIAKTTEIRKPFYVNLEYAGEKLLPFYSLTMEIKDAGWYAPRGVAQLNASFEAYCTKLWNDKADAMTFANKPMFTSEKEIPNSTNWKFQPGEYVPGMLQEVVRSQPPYSFSDEINFTRSLSERRSRVPDFGQFSPDEQSGPAGGGKPITATQSKISAGLQAVGSDHNGDIFRNVRLVKIHRHGWACIAHREELARLTANPNEQARKIVYFTPFAQDSIKVLPAQSLHDQYLVIPAGGSGTRQTRLKEALMLYNTYKGNPGINQDELNKLPLAAMDHRLINKLVIPQNVKGPTEAFQQDLELVVMSQGRPVPVQPGQDHVTHIMECLGFLHKQHVTGQPIDPMAYNVINQHIAQHFAILQQQQPEVAKKLKAFVGQQLMQQQQQDQMQARARGMQPHQPQQQIAAPQPQQEIAA